ncbi:MAG: glycoside hydrolase family 9 protein, partial [Candidatus Magasanikbacteria bacterium]|nr:glycoside hydrolase family 9 protein [Candidatus Magasanikbacteria bacterium]
MFKKNLLIILFFSSIQFSCNAAAGGEIFVRANQVGFLPNDIKTAIIMSKGNLTNTSFNIVNAKSEKTVFKGKIDTSRGKWGNFPFNYQIDFSRITDAGVYHIEIENKKSFTFKISKNIYDGITDSLLLFLKVQRCGPTKPFLHEPCHLYDSPQVIGDDIEGGIDVTGGWHDAGDYVKFLNSTAYTTYMLLFSYEFDKSKFEFDHNKNG